MCSEPNKVLSIQDAAFEFGLSSSGRNGQTWQRAMQTTQVFLNQVQPKDVLRVNVQDLLRGGAPLIYFRLKILTKDLFLDIEQLEQLKPHLVELVLNALENQESRLDKHAQNIVSRLRRTHSPGMFGKLMQKISGRKDHAPQDQKLEGHLDRRFELRRMQYLLDNPEHEKHDLAKEALDKAFTGQRDQLDQALAEDRTQDAEVLEVVPRYILGGDSSRDNHYLTYLHDVVSPQNAMEYTDLKVIRSQHEIAPFLKTWDRCRDQLGEPLDPKILDTAADLLGRGRLFMTQAVDRGSAIYAALEAESFLGEKTNYDRRKFEEWLGSNFVGWFNLSSDILRHLDTLAGANEQTAALIERRKLRPRKHFDPSRISSAFHHKVEGILLDYKLEDEFNAQDFLKLGSLWRKLNQINRNLLEHYLWRTLQGSDSRLDQAVYPNMCAWSELQWQVLRTQSAVFAEVPLIQSIPENELFAAVRRFRTLKAPDFQGLNLPAYNAEYYHRKLKKALDKGGLEQCLRLLMLQEELRQTPNAGRQYKVLEHRGSQVDSADGRDLMWLHIYKNNQSLEVIGKKLVSALNHQVVHMIESESEVSDRLVFEAFGLVDFFYEDLTAGLDLIRERTRSSVPSNEVDGLVEFMENLESQILEAQRVSSDKNTRQVLLTELKAAYNISVRVGKHIVIRLGFNAEQLKMLLVDLGGLFTDLQPRFNLPKYYARSLQYDDVDALKKYYGIVENIATSDLKMFADNFKKRTAALDELFKRLEEDPESAVKPLREVITRRVLKEFRNNNRISPRVKLYLLTYDEGFLESEMRHLRLFLNLSNPAECNRRQTYLSLINMFKETLGDKGNYRMLRGIRNTLRDLPKVYTPKIYMSLFRFNHSKLMKDLEEVIGSRLDFR